MEITIWIELIAAILIAAIIGFIAGLIANKCNDAKVGLGCALMFPVTLVFFVGFQFILPNVTVIHENNGSYTHNKSEYFKNYVMPDGHTYSLALRKSYIANTTDEPLILYPVYYGPNTSKGPEKEEEPILIEPNTVICVNQKPDKYFETPDNQISTKSNSVEVRWILEPLRRVAEREGFSINDIEY